MKDSFDGAMGRILRISITLGLVGSALIWIWYGPKAGAGFLIGAALSLINLQWWTAVAAAIGGTGKAVLRASALILTLRYLLIGGVIYAIVKSLKISPAAPLAGVLVSVAAVMLEALYELIYART